jgi:monofunctional biosynthetic peptidoglycan transglycosylase
MKNNEKGKKIRGGSTISQQTAKNIFFGRAEAGSEKDWKQFIPLLSKKSGIKTLFLKDI